MHSNTTLTALALILGLGAAGTALADDATDAAASGSSADQQSPGDASADAGQDGWIDADEATKVGATAFGGFDADADGSISRDEYLKSVGGVLTDRQKMRSQNMETLGASLKPRDDTTFAPVDADGDGKLTRHEYMAHAEQTFTTGTAGQKALASDAYAGAMVQSYDPMAADLDGDKSISSWEAAADVELDFGMRDADGDDIISMEEWTAKLDQPYDPARSEKRFSNLDADGNGRLSQDELSAWQSTTSTGAVTRSSDTAESSDATKSMEPAAGAANEDGWTDWTFRRYHF